MGPHHAIHSTHTPHPAPYTYSPYTTLLPQQLHHCPAFLPTPQQPAFLLPEAAGLPPPAPTCPHHYELPHPLLHTPPRPACYRTRAGGRPHLPHLQEEERNLPTPHLSHLPGSVGRGPGTGHAAHGIRRWRPPRHDNLARRRILERHPTPAGRFPTSGMPPSITWRATRPHPRPPTLKDMLFPGGVVALTPCPSLCPPGCGQVWDKTRA